MRGALRFFVFTMFFRTHKPRAPLCDFVENLWVYNGFESPRLKERIFPTGTFELVFNLRDDELRIYRGAQSAKRERFSGALISGPYAGFFMTDTAEEASVMGVRFKPGGIFPFLGYPADEMAGRHIDLDAIWGRAAARIRERLCETASPVRRLRILERWLLSRLFNPPEHHGAVSLALATTSPPRAQMTRELAREAGLSEKRFIDVFRLEVGLNPKVFNRIQRFQRVLVQVHRTLAPDWAQLALTCGYFDQSHLIRDFLSFSGFSPTDYVRRLDDLRHRGLHAKFNHLPLTE